MQVLVQNVSFFPIMPAPLLFQALVGRIQSIAGGFCGPKTKVNEQLPSTVCIRLCDECVQNEAYGANKLVGPHLRLCLDDACTACTSAF